MSRSRADWTEALGRARYCGGAFGWVFLLLMGGLNLFRGSIHLFTQDGESASLPSPGLRAR